MKWDQQQGYIRTYIGKQPLRLITDIDQVLEYMKTPIGRYIFAKCPAFREWLHASKPGDVFELTITHDLINFHEWWLR